MATESLIPGSAEHNAPLAARMRPQSIGEVLGQAHLLGEGQALSESIAAGELHSMVLWGPPGSGKTTLARLVTEHANAHFIGLSAVLAGVKEIRAAVERALKERREHNRDTVLFLDEAHRFNKAQQDAFLPFVEDGTLIFIGATTENPSFELNRALLSRLRVHVLRPLEEEQLGALLQRALDDEERGLGGRGLQLSETGMRHFARLAAGDARRALNLLELYAQLCARRPKATEEELLRDLLQGSPQDFDKGGDRFYEQISALHKSVRGSDPDASLYWLARMLEGGCDPLYIARRLVRMASEDVGNADPRALSLSLDAWSAMERLGSPEGELALAQATVYLACVPKSNACYTAFGKAVQDARQHPAAAVPMHLRNAPTALMKELGYGKRYRYAHDEPEAYAAGENYFPAEMGARNYYHPSGQGLEARIAERLKTLRERDRRQRAQETGAGKTSG